MTEKALSEAQETVSELFFLKYKGIPSPLEAVAQSKRYGFKCKKYANWSEVHVSDKSRQLLKQVGDSLIDNEEFDLTAYSEFSQIWERVQRWAIDKENFAIEPEKLEEFQKISRLIDVGSKNPNVVDLIIGEFGLNIELIDESDRWVIFLAICIFNFFHSKNRYKDILDAVSFTETVKRNHIEFLNALGDLITSLYNSIGFDTSPHLSRDVMLLFVEELGFSPEPLETLRTPDTSLRSLPKVWFQKYEGPQSELVKFNYASGDISVNLNQVNKIFSSDSELAQLLSNEEYWMLIGKSIESHLGQIDDIQDFFDTFAKHLRLRD